MRGMARTKIVATIGPASSTLEVVKGMIEEGMSVARTNFSHGTLSEKSNQIDLVRKAANELGMRIGIMSDLQGPEVRTHMGKKELKVEEGEIVTVSGKDGYGEIKIKPSSVLRSLKEGDEIYIDGGRIWLRVESVKEDLLRCSVVHGGVIGDKRSVHASKPFDLKGLTEEDEQAIKLSVEKKVDFIALSFVKTADDVIEVKEFLKSITDDPPALISKIETREAVEKAKEIIEESYGIMVARGDLGVELPLEEVPRIQERLIRLANEQAKPVITATEMLESMTKSPVPTRAEVTDVYNAIIEGSDAVMLSAETAVGRYPVLSVRWMRKIAESAERFLEPKMEFSLRTKAAFIGKAAVEASELLGSPIILCFTYSGFTARHVVRHRPKAKILALLSREKTKGLLTLSWGVESILVPRDVDEAIKQAVNHCLEEGWLREDDAVVVTFGHPHGRAKTNSLRILGVKEVLDQAEAGEPNPSSTTGPSS